MNAVILRGDARHLPLADASVDLIVTSPPYFALRSYTDGGEHYDGQIGAEATPREYIDSLVECTREWTRVLKPSGSIWVNLGDKYAGVADGRNNNGFGGGSIAATHSQPAISDRQAAAGKRFRVSFGAVRTKSLLMIPERYRIACVDELGLIARAVVVWDKPNGLPESVTDRVRRSHEDWVHLTKLPRYFSAVDEIREAHAEPGGRPAYARQRPPAPGGNRGLHVGRMDHAAHRDMGQSPLGKLPGSVWEIATEPLKVPDHVAHERCCLGAKQDGCEDGVDHFAAFPTEWPRRIILGWSPSGICVECGEGRRPVTERTPMVVRPSERRLAAQANGNAQRTATGGTMVSPPEARITGEACACPDTTAPTSPSVVLDPFSGTGTTPMVAKALGRTGIGVEMSADYCRLAMWRVNDEAQLAKVRGDRKPVKQAEGQIGLDFEGLAS